MIEAIHQMALLPLAVLLLTRGRTPEQSWWLVAGLSMSWVADSLAWFMGGAWEASYLWLPIQFALVAAAFIDGSLRRLVLANVFAALAIVSQAVSAPGPDLILTIVGSVTVLVLARGPLKFVVWAYFGVGTVAYLWMATSLDSDMLPAWYTYHATRLVAYLIFAGIALRHSRLERRVECGKSYPV